MHLFIVPKSMTNLQIRDFVEGMKKQLKNQDNGIVVASNIKYNTLMFNEGEQFSIVRKGDAFEFIKIGDKD